MKRAHHHPFAEIELVRLRPLRAGIERTGLAVRGPREPLQVLHQRPADAPGAQLLVGHQVVDIEVKSLESVLADAVYGDAAHGAPFGRDAHARASGEHALHLALVIGDVDDVHDLSSPSLRNISLIPRTAWRDRASFSISAMRT